MTKQFAYRLTEMPAGALPFAPWVPSRPPIRGSLNTDLWREVGARDCKAASLSEMNTSFIKRTGRGWLVISPVLQPRTAEHHMTPVLWRLMGGFWNVGGLHLGRETWTKHSVYYTSFWTADTWVSSYFDFVDFNLLTHLWHQSQLL